MSAEQRQNTGQLAPTEDDLRRVAAEVYDQLEADRKARRKRETKEATLVYFVRAQTVGLIKIGIAADPDQRLATLQVGSPDRLTLLGVIAPPDAARTESDLHAAFHRERRHGEWFEPSPRLLDFIQQHAVTPATIRSDRLRAWAATRNAETILPVTQQVGHITVDVGQVVISNSEPKKARLRGTPKERLAAYKAARGLA